MIYLKNDFNEIHTFECGQCFRWNKQSDGSYIGISSDKICKVNNGTVLCNDNDNDFWNAYFCVNTDYGLIKKTLTEQDDNLKKCIDYGSGIRILNQDIWETIVSFIISSNNNIPRIKKIIETMCQNFGDKINTNNIDYNIDNSQYYSFPSADAINNLDISDLACLRAGYRDKYIMDAAAKVSSGEVNLNEIVNMPTQDAKYELMKIKGVGGKVADCILLFSMGRYELFPKDVWIKRILDMVYSIKDAEIDTFVSTKYGELAGYAQQYLYYYYRDNDITEI